MNEISAATIEYKNWLEECLKLTDLTSSERKELEATLETVLAKIKDSEVNA